LRHPESPVEYRVRAEGTGDLDGLYEKLKARGVEFDAPPHDEPWERLAWAHDPDDYTLEFAQGERAAPPRARRRRKA
jgi:hypothetical protein